MQAPIDFWGVTLDPSPHRDVIGVHAPLGQQFLHVAVRIARVVVQVVLVISFIIAGKNTMSTFGWGGGAEIGTNKQTKGVMYVVGASQNPQSGH